MIDELASLKASLLEALEKIADLDASISDIETEYRYYENKWLEAEARISSLEMENDELRLKI